MTTTYSGYFNYYIGTVLKTYSFKNISEKLYFAYRKLFRMISPNFCRAIVCMCEVSEDTMKGYEMRTLVEEDSLVKRENAETNLCKISND